MSAVGRWLARVQKFGLNRNAVMVPSHTLPELALRLEGAPVRAAWIGGRLDHLPRDVDPRDPAHLVGDVVRVWVDGGAVFAVLALTDPLWHRRLLAMAANGDLSAMGVSLAAEMSTLEYGQLPDGREIRILRGWASVRALDFVGSPANEGACLLREWTDLDEAERAAR